MTTGLPAPTVLLDDGTGAYPYDVTAFARWPESISWSRGRSDEHNQNQPGAFTLAFDNTDGAFTPGAAVNLMPDGSYETGALGLGGNQVGSTIIFTFDSTVALSGTKSIKLTVPIGGTGNLGYGNGRVACLPGQTVSHAIWIKRAAGAGNIRIDLQWFDSGGVALSASAFTDVSLTAAPVGTWVRATVVGQVAPASTAFVRARAYYTTYVAGTDIANFDLCQVELGPAATFEVFNDQGIRIADSFPGDPAALNLAGPDPSFETSTCAFTLNTGTLTSDATHALYGAKSLKVVPGSENYGFYQPNGTSGKATCVVGQTYTASMYVFSTTNQLVALMDYGTNNTQGPAVNVVAGVWTRLSVTFVAGANVFISVRDPGRVRTIDQVWFDGFMLSNGSVLLPFTELLTPKVVTRWTGKVQNWPVSWPSGDDTLSIVTATATDVLAQLSRGELSSATTTEIVADAPAGYWPCSEQSEFATQVHDVTSTQPVLAAYNPNGDVIVNFVKFGQDLGTPDGAKGVQLATNALALYPLAPKAALTYVGSSLHFEITYFLPVDISAAAPATTLTLLSFQDGNSGAQNGFVNLVSSSGVIQVLRGTGDAVYSVINTSSMKAGLHTLALDTDGTSSHLTLDGVLIDSRAGFAHTYDLTGGTQSFKVAGGSITSGSFSVVVGNIAVGPRLTDARTSLHQQAILSDLSGETPAVRIARILGYVGVPAGSLDAAGDTILGATDQGGRSPLAVLQDVEAADLGDLFGNAAGAVAYVAGVTRSSGVTPAGTFDASWLDQATQVIVDMFGVVNRATGTGSSGNVYGPVNDAASRLAHGDYPQDFQWNVSTDAQVVDRTNWMVGNYRNPVPRVAQLVLDLLTMDPVTVEAALALDLTSYIRVTGMPVQTPGGTQLDLIVEGITETIQATLTDAAWTLTLTASAKALSAAWVLGDATYGVLDSTTKLYV